MKRMVLVLVSAAFLSLVAGSASAHEYDRNDSEHPLRIFSYVVHPIGVFFEYTVTRPVHWLAHQRGFSYVMGHEPESIKPYVEDKTPATTVPQKPAMPEPPKPQMEKDKDISVTKTAEGTQYTIVGQAVLFAPGSADLTAQGQEIVGRLADMIKKDYANNEIVAQGFTDSQPIKYSKWKSNWELGGARALSLVHYLVDKAGFPADKVASMSFGESRNVVPNDSPENMAQNRRAVVTVKTNGSSVSMQVAPPTAVK
jgi:flagellar motor protein MotB